MVPRLVLPGEKAPDNLNISLKQGHIFHSWHNDSKFYELSEEDGSEIKLMWDDAAADSDDGS